MFPKGAPFLKPHILLSQAEFCFGHFAAQSVNEGTNSSIKLFAWGGII